MSDLGGPLTALRAWFGSGGDTLPAARIRAYGVDPNTGGLIAPQYSAVATAAGYDASNPSLFMDKVTAQVQSEYEADYQKFFNDPSVTSQGWLVVVIVLALAFFLIKAVK